MEYKTKYTIPDSLIVKIQDRLSNGKRVRRVLPLEGRLHIDRTLPFLIVYRRPYNYSDKATERLVMGEASYLIVSDDPRIKSSFKKLLRTIVQTIYKECKAFLIVEIFSNRNYGTKTDNDIVKPGFNIFTSKTKPPTRTVEALERSLGRIKILKKSAKVEVLYNSIHSRAGLPPLLSDAEAQSLNCFIVGLEIQPVYRNAVTGDIYPLVLRALHQGLAIALKKAVFEFSLNQTSHRPKNYQSLGRRAVVKAVWETDSQLSEISNSFDFLLNLTPINTEAAWNKFKQSHFEKVPVFYYRPLPIFPPLVKRKLYDIRIEKVEDPTLAFIFREKQIELERQLTMLWDRGKPEFLYGSLQLYGKVSDELVKLAKNILAKIPPRTRERGTGHSINAIEFAKYAKKEIEYYKNSYSLFTGKVYVRNDTVGLMVSRGNLLIGSDLKIHPSRIDALIQHEVGTHIVTYFNGKAQPFQQLYSGLSGYEELQEGLAVLAEYLIGGLSRPRMRLLAGRVIAADCLISGASFLETFRVLTHRFGFDQKTAFTITIRIYRGGGLVKDAIYLRGLVELLKYLKEGGELEPLFVGKIASDHVPVIQELQYRHVLKPAPLRPRYLDDPGVADKLSKLNNGLEPLELIERKTT
jgi:uncharacterized protein (TIGR02421 family)